MGWCNIIPAPGTEDQFVYTSLDTELPEDQYVFVAYVSPVVGRMNNGSRWDATSKTEVPCSDGSKDELIRREVKMWRRK